MRYRFHAVDENGRAIRQVLRAENEEDAREMLLGENLFPKRLEEVGEEEKVTWVSRKHVQVRHDQHRAQSGPSNAEEHANFEKTFQTVLPTAGIRQGGRLGIAADESVRFESANNDNTVIIRREDVESASIAGFPMRTLRVFMLDGRLLEFSAGLVFADSTAKAIMRKLKEK